VVLVSEKRKKPFINALEVCVVLARGFQDFEFFSVFFFLSDVPHFCCLLTCITDWRARPEKSVSATKNTSEQIGGQKKQNKPGKLNGTSGREETERREAKR